MQDTIQTFIEKFLIPTPGKSPQAIKDRILHWVEVANHPEKFTSTQDIHAIAAKRKNARQCVKDLAARHPDIIAVLSAERTEERTNTPEVA